MKPVELRDLETEDLYLRLRELKEELFNLRFQLATGQLDNHRRIAHVKRDVARIRTVIREREIEHWEEHLAATAATAAPADESAAGTEEVEQ